jgi:MFS family permease
LIPWADQAANQRAKSDDTAAPASTQPQADPPETSLGTETPATDPRRKAALTQITRSGGAIIGSLLGGWIASLLGRRITYFLISLISLATSSYIFNVLDPLDPQFTLFTFLLGFVGVTYFGWLPLYLPELFPTRVRSTGTGITFNSGRILAAASVLGAGGLMQLFGGDYARVGTFTGLIYAVGMVIICFAPDTTRQPVED